MNTLDLVAKRIKNQKGTKALVIKNPHEIKVTYFPPKSVNTKTNTQNETND